MITEIFQKFKCHNKIANVSGQLMSILKERFFCGGGGYRLMSWSKMGNEV